MTALASLVITVIYDNYDNERQPMDPFEAEIAALQQRRTAALWRQTEGLCIAELEAMPSRLLARLYRRYQKRRAKWLARQEWIRQAAIALPGSTESSSTGALSAGSGN